MQPRHAEAVIFSAKAACGGVMAALCYDFFHLPGAVWAAISAVLVTQPDLHASLKSSLTRVVANLAGAFGGAALAGIFNHALLALAVGVMLTGLVCYFLKVEDAMRPAFAAVVIVIFTADTTKWHNSLDRVVAVIVGCACALIIGFLFDKLSTGLKLFQNQKSSEKNGKNSGGE